MCPLWGTATNGIVNIHRKPKDFENIGNFDQKDFENIGDFDQKDFENIGDLGQKDFEETFFLRIFAPKLRH